MNQYQVETSGSETDADSASSNMRVDCWWTSKSSQDPWHHPLVGVELDGKIDFDVTETCMMHDDEDGWSSCEEFWINGLEQDDCLAKAVVEPADLFSPELVPLNRQPFDLWDYIATEDFLVNDLAMDDTAKNEGRIDRLVESRRDQHSELHLADGVSTTKQLGALRTRLAASMRASQKSRRECWHSNRKLQHLMPNQRHRNQVQKVLEEIAWSTATVKHHCL
jgi:hypothetical protein